MFYSIVSLSGASVIDDDGTAEDRDIEGDGGGSRTASSIASITTAERLPPQKPQGEFSVVMTFDGESFCLVCDTKKQLDELREGFKTTQARMPASSSHPSRADVEAALMSPSPSCGLNPREGLIETLTANLTRDRVAGTAGTAGRQQWMKELDTTATELQPLKRSLVLSKLLRTWFVVAIKPSNVEEAALVEATETYRWNEETGQMDVVLKYYDAALKTRTMQRVAWIANPSTMTEWRVMSKYQGGVSIVTPHMIIACAHDYTYWMLGDRHRTSLKILSSTPTLKPAELAELKARAIECGYSNIEHELKELVGGVFGGQPAQEAQWTRNCLTLKSVGAATAGTFSSKRASSNVDELDAPTKAPPPHAVACVGAPDKGPAGRASEDTDESVHAHMHMRP